MLDSSLLFAYTLFYNFQEVNKNIKLKDTNNDAERALKQFHQKGHCLGYVMPKIFGIQLNISSKVANTSFWCKFLECESPALVMVHQCLAVQWVFIMLTPPPSGGGGG